MIPYVEVIGKYSLKSFALVEPSQCWFEISYYDIGQFEIYANATTKNANALKNGNYVKLPNRDFLWVIKSVEYKFSADGSRMIDAKGYEAKWLLHNRIIMTPWELPNDLGEATFQLVDGNLGESAVSYRKIVGFSVDTSGFTGITLSDENETQATRGDLWDFIQPLLKAHNCGSIVTFNGSGMVFKAVVGADKSARVIFSRSLDNLISTDYFETSTADKTYCQVVSIFTEKNDNGKSTSTPYIQEYDKGGKNIDRRETTIQPNLSTKDSDGNDISPESDQFKGWQIEAGKNALAGKTITRTFSGEIDIEHSRYTFGEDFSVGDLISIIDEVFGYRVTARIVKYTFKQDSGGYGEEADYQSE